MRTHAAKDVNACSNTNKGMQRSLGDRQDQVINQVITMTHAYEECSEKGFSVQPEVKHGHDPQRAKDQYSSGRNSKRHLFLTREEVRFVRESGRRGGS